MAAFLGQIGGREVDGDPFGGKREARRNERRSHPVTRLRHRLVGEPDEVEGRQARRDLHLHVHRTRFDPFKCNGGDVLDHRLPLRLQPKGARWNPQEQ
jgi:hypothetical protein